MKDVSRTPGLSRRGLLAGLAAARRLPPPPRQVTRRPPARAGRRSRRKKRLRTPGAPSWSCSAPPPDPCRVARAK